QRASIKRVSFFYLPVQISNLLDTYAKIWTSRAACQDGIFRGNYQRKIKDNQKYRSFFMTKKCRHGAGSQYESKLPTARRISPAQLYPVVSN
ncbi:MAG: hypothetical protein K9G33_13780, partial [Sneathiella sp.]|nr:hypothetical protein [Sneathiella sp.]